MFSKQPKPLEKVTKDGIVIPEPEENEFGILTCIGAFVLVENECIACDYNEVAKDGECKPCTGTTFPNKKDNTCVDC